MRMRIGARSVRCFCRLAAAVLVALGGASPGWAQPPAPPPPPSAQPASPAGPAELPSASQVFPEGGFPTSPPTPEGGIPSTARPGSAIAYPAPQLPTADYAPPGYQAREVQSAPGEPEFYHPISEPLPDYYYRPSYYDTPGIGARALADYAPPGYEARETDEGQAP